MKLTTALLLIGLLNLSAKSYSQESRLSFSLKDASIQEVLDVLEKSTNLKFLYRNETLSNQKVTILAKDATVDEILEQALANTDVSYKLLANNLVVITPKGFLQQQVTVSGKVIDPDGIAMPGVNVTVKGTTQGVMTDADGKYSIKVTDPNVTLVFSFVGFLSEEIAVQGKTQIDVTLVTDVKKLDEIVVVGYGKQKKETVVGAVSSIKGKELLKSPAVNLSNSIAGRIPGVITMQNSGEPGADGSTIRIRGSNTLGNNDPLVVIDGVAARAGGLERLDPADIESMSVLKDASAAIYGARAANGVILITTKRGKIGKPSVNYSFNQGWAQPTKVPEMANAAQFAVLNNELDYNSKMKNPATDPGYDINTVLSPRYSAEDIQKFKDGSDPWGHPNTDWYGAVFKTWSPQSHHSLQFEGGSEKIKYFSTLGYKSEDAYYKNSATSFQQFNGRINLDAEISKYIKTSFDVSGRQEVRNYPMRAASDIFRFVLRGRPTDPAFWPNGLAGPDQEYGDNPVVTTTDATGYDKDKRYYLQTNAKVEITNPWIEGLKFTASASWDKYIKYENKFIKPWYLYTWDGKTYEADGITPKLNKGLRGPNIDKPQLTKSSEDQTNLVTSGILSYDKKFGNHIISVVAGIEKETSENDNFNAYRKYYLSDAVQTLSAGGDKEKTNGSGAWERARLNYFGRVAYNFKETYLAEFVWRYDGSYMFPEDKRFGFFPGILLGYRISNESFWKDNITFMDYLKVRASWGQMGNDQIWYNNALQEYQYMSTYRYEWGYVVDNQDVKGLRINQFPNNNVTWERANNYNLGIEGRIFNKLSFEFDIFDNKRSNILWQRNASVPQSTGLTLPAENIGKVDNRGVDFKLEWNDKATNDLYYSISINGGYAKNKITYWDEAAGAPDWQKSTGHPMNTGLYYVYDGVFKNWDEINDPARPDYSGITNDAGLRPGDMKFQDLNGDGKITGDDQKRFDKNRQPTLTGGVNLFAQFKGFDLTILFQGAAGNWGRLFTESGSIGNYLKDFADNHWTNDNPSSTDPRAFDRGGDYWGGGNAKNNTYWMQDLKYVRLKNLELGYTLPKTLLAKAGITNTRIYVNGLNLLTLTPAKNIDPESSADGGQYYPQAKVLNFGFSLTF